jgi:hypothetical protein
MAHPTKPSKALYKHGPDAPTFDEIAQVIQKNLAALKKPGVISIRPGYKAVGGWITRKPAIVVSTRNKAAAPPPEDALPAKVEGYPVDVRQASQAEILRADSPKRFAALTASPREEATLPDFPGEVTVNGDAIPAKLDLIAMSGRPPKQQIPYTPAPNASLNRVEGPMSILCHASPDAGWPTLKAFLDDVSSQLTVGMYDFTSAHILQGVEHVLTGTKKLTLVLDHPTKNPTADQTDEETVDSLDTKLGNRFSQAWALERSDPKVSKWIFPSAYHIKVAVRDHKTLWLSSGNWNNSNQPDIDPVADPEGSAAVAKKSDRDYHVVVEHTGLAKTFEAFLAHDFSVASQVGPAPADMAAAAAPLAEDLEALTVDSMLRPKDFKKFFPPLRVPNTGTKTIAIQPLLTPDNYNDFVLPLIQSATRTFYMQAQYIHPGDDETLGGLIGGVIELQQKGVVVRIILSQWQTMGGWVDKLQATGMDMNSVRIQNGVHNKAIIVDSKVVMLGSQNWSGEGVTTNRDASLVIEDDEVAQYYEGIFLHDWVNLASQSGLS